MGTFFDFQANESKNFIITANKINILSDTGVNNLIILIDGETILPNAINTLKYKFKNMKICTMASTEFRTHWTFH
jgi:hypothetical protein